MTTLSEDTHQLFVFLLLRVQLSVILFFPQISGVFLTNQIKWVGCQGSRPELRGYTCSLWKLFHTLTVQAGTHPDALDDTGNVPARPWCCVPLGHRDDGQGHRKLSSGGLAVRPCVVGALLSRRRERLFRSQTLCTRCRILPPWAQHVQGPSPGPGRACVGISACALNV